MKDVTGRQHDSEAGIALFYALLVTLVVGGIVAVVFATAIGEQRQAAFELDFEDTIHVAEAGAEVYLGQLVDDNSLNSGIPGPSDPGTPADPAEWALEAATAGCPSACQLDVVATADGETVPLRPTGEDAEFIYGVGFTPSRDAFMNGLGEPYARVVRVQVAFAPNTFVPDYAMLTGGNLRLAGNYKILGSTGAVHTNGAIEVIGGSGTASGGITYSGTCLTGCSQASGPVATKDLSPIDILDFYGSGEYSGDAEKIATFDRQWYEYCSGTWYLRGRDQQVPCDATNPTRVAAPAGDSNLQPWTGLSYNNPTLPSDAVYFFAGGEDVDIKQPSGALSVFTGGDITIGPSASTDPPDPRYPGFYLLAEGSITIGGNAAAGTFETTTPGIVWANETVTLKGTLETNQLAFIGVDGANLGSSYSGGGSGSVTYDGDASVVIPGERTPLVVQWDEVFAP